MNKIIKVINDPRLLNNYWNALNQRITERRLRNKIIKDFFSDPNEYDFYINELNESNFLDSLIEKENDFISTVKGYNYRNKDYDFGKIDFDSASKMYAIIRNLKPEILVETGVCNGISSAFILRALKENELGELYSIDLPEEAETKYDSNYFWKDKGGSVIPKNNLPGWLIPDDLRSKWKLIIGKTQEKLPILLKQLKNIDFFLHDSEHSYECMLFEYRQAYNYISKKGIIFSDDYNANNALNDFSNEIKKQYSLLNKNVAYIKF